MGQGVTDWGAGALIRVLFGIDAPLAGFWIGLLSEDAGPAMDGAAATDLEPDGGGYARQAYGVGGGNWTYDSGVITNLNEIPFPIPTLDWGRITDWALLDAASDGGLYTWDELPEPVNVDAGYQLVIPPGAIAIGITSVDETYVLD